MLYFNVVDDDGEKKQGCFAVEAFEPLMSPPVKRERNRSNKFSEP